MNQGPIPRDARIMALIASSMGIQDFEPSVLIQLLDFAHRHTYDVLQDATMYADHASSSTRGMPSSVSLDDLQLAVQSRVNYSFTQPPSKEMLLSLATSLNNVPLPPISDGFGVRLPPRKQRLTNVNFNVLPNAPPPDLDEEEEESNVEQVVTEEQKERDGPSRPLGEDDEYDDEEMDKGTQSASKDATSGGAGPPTESDARGTKRRLEEDEEYD